METREFTFFAPLEFRADETRQSPGLLAGTLMVYGQKAKDRPEMFRQDSLYWDTDTGITITEQHDRNAQMVRTMPYLEGRELKINAPLPNTTRGRDTATNMAGPLPLYSGLSVTFRAEKESRQGGVRVIERAFLAAAGLVDTPSYIASTVEVREGLAVIGHPAAATLWL